MKRTTQDVINLGFHDGRPRLMEYVEFAGVDRIAKGREPGRFRLRVSFPAPRGEVKLTVAMAGGLRLLASGETIELSTRDLREGRLPLVCFGEPSRVRQDVEIPLELAFPDHEYSETLTIDLRPDPDPPRVHGISVFAIDAGMVCTSVGFSTEERPRYLEDWFYVASRPDDAAPACASCARPIEERGATTRCHACLGLHHAACWTRERTPCPACGRKRSVARDADVVVERGGGSGCYSDILHARPVTSSYLLLETCARYRPFLLGDIREHRLLDRGDTGGLSETLLKDVKLKLRSPGKEVSLHGQRYFHEDVFTMQLQYFRRLLRRHGYAFSRGGRKTFVALTYSATMGTEARANLRRLAEKAYNPRGEPHVRIILLEESEAVAGAVFRMLANMTPSRAEGKKGCKVPDNPDDIIRAIWPNEALVDGAGTPHAGEGEAFIAKPGVCHVLVLDFGGKSVEESDVVFRIGRVQAPPGADRTAEPRQLLHPGALDVEATRNSYRGQAWAGLDYLTLALMSVVQDHMILAALEALERLPADQRRPFADRVAGRGESWSPALYEAVQERLPDVIEAFRSALRGRPEVPVPRGPGDDPATCASLLDLVQEGQLAERYVVPGSSSLTYRAEPTTVDPRLQELWNALKENWFNFRDPHRALNGSSETELQRLREQNARSGLQLRCVADGLKRAFTMARVHEALHGASTPEEAVDRAHAAFLPAFAEVLREVGWLPAGFSFGPRNDRGPEPRVTRAETAPESAPRGRIEVPRGAPRAEPRSDEQLGPARARLREQRTEDDPFDRVFRALVAEFEDQPDILSCVSIYRIAAPVVVHLLADLRRAAQRLQPQAPEDGDAAPAPAGSVFLPNARYLFLKEALEAGLIERVDFLADRDLSVAGPDEQARFYAKLTYTVRHDELGRPRRAVAYLDDAALARVVDDFCAEGGAGGRELTNGSCQRTGERPPQVDEVVLKWLDRKLHEHGTPREKLPGAFRPVSMPERFFFVQDPATQYLTKTVVCLSGQGSRFDLIQWAARHLLRPLQDEEGKLYVWELDGLEGKQACVLGAASYAADRATGNDVIGITPFMLPPRFPCELDLQPNENGKSGASTPIFSTRDVPCAMTREHFVFATRFHSNKRVAQRYGIGHNTHVSFESARMFRVASLEREDGAIGFRRVEPCFDFKQEPAFGDTDGSTKLANFEVQAFVPVDDAFQPPVLYLKRWQGDIFGPTDPAGFGAYLMHPALDVYRGQALLRLPEASPYRDVHHWNRTTKEFFTVRPGFGGRLEAVGTLHLPDDVLPPDETTELKTPAPVPLDLAPLGQVQAPLRFQVARSHSCAETLPEPAFETFVSWGA